MKNQEKENNNQLRSDIFKSERMEEEEAEARTMAIQKGENYDHSLSNKIRIPGQYRADDTEENKVIYALSLIGEGSAEDVSIKVSELDRSIEPGGFSHMAEPVLQNLCGKGLITCRMEKELGYYSIPPELQHHKI